MTQSLFVFFSCAVSLMILVFIARKDQVIICLLIAGFLFRLLLMFLNAYGIFEIPGSSHDAAAYMRHARHLATLSWSDMFSIYDPTHSFNGYGFYGAVAIKAFGYSDLIMPSLNLIAGSIVMGVSALIVNQMWGSKAARLSTLILALYPFAAFNSAVALREEFAIAAFVVGVYFILQWVRSGALRHVVFAIAFLGVATTIHAGFVGAFVGLFAYLLFTLWRSIKKLFVGRGLTQKQGVRSLVGLTYLLLLVGMIKVGGGLSLGKGIVIGGESDSEMTELIESRFQREATGGSAYPSAITTGDPFSQPWLIPARMVYFHFSPFIWDIRSPRHVLGLISSVLYVFLAFRIYKGWRQLKGREETLLLLLMFGALTFVFAVGVTNVGTAIRHKTKLLVLILALAASSFNTIKTKFRLK
ncbi:MAG: hypothetical protein JJU03_04440 [Idiomarina sp.]|nr:hypothetical protein [Idiomarina sp.]